MTRLLRGELKPMLGEKENPRSHRALIVAIIVGAIIIAIGLAIGLSVGLRNDDDHEKVVKTVSRTLSVPKSSGGVYNYASVVTDSKICSDIGAEVLARQQGNAVDATVASLLCTGVVQAHSAGIGGGAFFVYYDKKSREVHSVTAREAAPGGSTEDMFRREGVPKSSFLGGFTTAVPGELMGLYSLHAKFGRVPWRSLVQPTIKLCQEGVPLTKALHHAVKTTLHHFSRKYIDAFSMYLDENNHPPPVGTPIKLPKLAATFQTIADDPLSFYNGSLAEHVQSDILEMGGITTVDDLRNYTVSWTQPIALDLPGDLKMYSVPPPGSGLVLSMVLSILSGYGMNPSNVATNSSTILTAHRTVEALKFAFGKRSELGDVAFVDMVEHIKNMTSRTYGEHYRAMIDDSRTHGTEYYQPAFSSTNDGGTTQLSVLDSEGNAVSATSSINTYFGSKVKGKKTGIVFSNVMDDFTTTDTVNHFGLPPSPANKIAPGKRPMSSMCPVIVLDKDGNVVLVTGSAGGSKIASTNTLNIMDVLWFNETLQHAVDKQRFHHQLLPPELQLSKHFPKFLKDGLAKKGHTFKPMDGFSVIQAIHVTKEGLLHGVADYRKGGEPAGF